MSYSYSPQFFLFGSWMLSFLGTEKLWKCHRFLHGWTWRNGNHFCHFQSHFWKLKQPEWPWGSSIWDIEVFEGMTADCPTFWAKAFPQISCPHLKQAQKTLIDVRCWLKLDKIARHHTWSLVRSTRRCGIWDYCTDFFNNPMIPMVPWHQDPLDEIKPKCLSSCQDWLFAPQRKCTKQELNTFPWTEIDLFFPTNCRGWIE